MAKRQQQGRAEEPAVSIQEFRAPIPAGQHVGQSAFFIAG